MPPTDLDSYAGEGMRLPFTLLAAILALFLTSCSHTAGVSKKTSDIKVAFNTEAKAGSPSPAPVVDNPSRLEEGVFHIVGRAETLEHVCKVYGLDFELVARINKLKPPYALKSGDTIFLPASAMLDLGVQSEKVTASNKKPEPGKKVAKNCPARDKARALRAQRNPEVPYLKFPVSGGELSSPFGYRRGVFHKGLDVAAPVGTPVTACADGKVIFTGTRKKFRSYGNICLLDHGNGVYTQYAHLNDIKVKKGAKIRQGQRIGSVGNTGRSTGPHLHLEVRVKNNLYNPLPYFSQKELKGIRVARRFSDSPMGPVRARWRIPELLTARR